MSLALWLLVYLLVTYAIGKLWELVVGWKTTALIFYPGVLVAAGGRMLACAIGQEKSGKADVMRSGGPTDSQPPAGGPVFRFLYTVLPYALCLATFVVAWHMFDEPVSAQKLPTLEFGVEAVGDSASAAGNLLNAVWRDIKGQEIGNVQFWLFLYVGFALIVAPAPGRHDLVGIAALCCVLGVVTFLLQQAGIEVVVAGVYKGTFWKGFSLLVGLSLAVLLLSAIILLPIKLMGRKEKS